MADITSLPDGWQMHGLADLGEVNRGRSRHRPRYAEHLYGGPYPFIQTGDIRTSGGRITSHSTTYSEAGLAQSRLWPAGTMCITIAANIAETAILTYPACFPDSVVGFIADPTRADVRFVEYAFRLLKSRLQQEAMGSVQDNINLEVLSRLRLPSPSLDEQAAIANVLGSLDDKIEQNRRTGRKLEALARAVFKAWFVDFEPVKAKAAGATVFPGMPAETFAALPARLVDSELGQVPEGWAVKTLEDVAEAVKGLSYKGAGLVAADAPDLSDSLPLHNLNSVYEGGGYKNEGIKRYRGDYKDRHVIYPGDLIVTNTEQGHEYRLIGFPAIVPKRFGVRGLFSHHIFRVRPLPGSTLGVHFLYYAIMSGRIREEIVGCTNGTTVNMLSADGLKRPRICTPPAAIATVFEQRAATMYDLSESLRDESAKLAALRDYLLPRLLSGRVRVANSQAMSQVESVALPQTIETAKPSRRANDEFKEAILIAALVRSLAQPSFPLGRKRYNKIAYLVHRKAEHDVRQTYRKKAAGPYSPWAKYQGPERIAVSNGYVNRAKVGEFAGLLPGEKIAVIDTYLPRYDFAPAIEWVVGKFRFRKNDELELLATVDFAAIDLRDRRVRVDAASVHDLLESEPEWAPKLERAIFSNYNIATALRELQSLFPADYGE